MPIHLISVPKSPFNGFPNTLSKSVFTSVVDGGCLQPTVMLAKYELNIFRNLSRPVSITYAFSKLQLGTLQLTLNVEEPPETFPYPHEQVDIELSLESRNTKEAFDDTSDEHLLNGLNDALHNGSDSINKISDKEYKEILRRRKIGLANKGKTPWNIGRKHSAETRARIKQRTTEALRDPKIKKRMSECPRVHSDQSKARISIALRRIWGERLRLKRSQKKCYLAWAQSIAEAAKEGGCDQHELDWDSYEKMKAEIIYQQLQWAADKAKAKEIAKARAELESKDRAEKRAMLAQVWKEREENKKAIKELKKKARRKSQEGKAEMTIFMGVKLKARLTKMHRKKHVAGLIANQGKTASALEPVIEKWDIEFVKKEKMRREVSLADMIQAAKSKRSEPPTLKTPWKSSPSEGNAGGVSWKQS